MSGAVRALEEFRKDQENRDANTVNLLATRWASVEDNLFREWQQLMENLAEQDTPPTTNQLLRLRRVQLLIQQAQEETEDYLQDATNIIDHGTREEIRRGINDSEMALSLSAKDSLSDPAFALSFARLPEQAINDLFALARQESGPLQSIMRGYAVQNIDGMINSMAALLGQGVNPRRAARQLRDQFRAMPNQVERLMRDQFIRNYRSSSQQTYLQSGLVSKYKRLAAKQRRTCAACIALDGTIYEVNQLMEVHPRIAARWFRS